MFESHLGPVSKRASFKYSRLEYGVFTAVDVCVIMWPLSVEDGSEEGTEQSHEQRDGEGGGEAAHPRQPALVHVEPVRLPLHQRDELRVQPLPVEVVDGVLEGVFVSLLAHAFVTSGLEASALDWHTLQQRGELDNPQHSFKMFSTLTYEVLSSHLCVLLKALGV